jgi:hypothetical protein
MPTPSQSAATLDDPAVTDAGAADDQLDTRSPRSLEMIRQQAPKSPLAATRCGGTGITTYLKHDGTRSE